MTLILETGRLGLREWTAGDADALFALVSDPEVMRYIEDGRPWTDVGLVREWIGRMKQSYRARGYSRWAVVERGGGRAVGSCGFAPLPWSGEIDFGYLFARDTWGRGYATEIGRAVLRHGFKTYGFAEVVASVVPEHTASRRVLEKLGFVYRRNEVQPGDEDESAIYALSNPARRAAAGGAPATAQDAD